MQNELIFYGDCEGCGCALMGPEKVYDSHDFTCKVCGMIHWMSCDEEGAYINTEGEYR